MQKSEFDQQMKEGLSGLKLNLHKEILERFWNYMKILRTENKKYNLTAITEPHEIISKHFFDSLAPLAFLSPAAGERIIDIGTGPGLPGLAYKIINPDLNLVLVDSVLKKANFLKLLTYKLGFNEGIEVIHARAEELGNEKDYRESFHWVVSRAVASLNILCEYTLPFIQRQGRAVLYKGPDYEAELDEAGEAVKILGGEIEQIRPVEVPGLKEERNIIIIKKINDIPGDYPRRPGIPKKRPL